ncbi:MAG TPA: CoA transferase, partial [Acidimicrobiales bacterium]
MAAALEGLRVVDLTSTQPGAEVTQLFADFGADVVLVEPPGGTPLRTQAAAPNWLRGKRSIELDLHDAGDLAVAKALCAEADVVVETWRPGVADRLGLGYDELSATNPRLVHGSITGFGRTGPYARLPGYEGIVMAKIGGYGQLHLTDRSGPSFSATPAASFNASQVLLHGLLAALYERETSGLGQRVETSLLAGQTTHDCWNWLIRMVAARYSGAFTAVPRVDEARRVPNGWLSFRLLVGLSKDGRWMQFSQTSERLWTAFMRVLGLEWMLTDPEWKDAHSSEDIDVREAYWERMLAVIRSKTIAEWYEVFDSEPDVFAEMFRTGTELLHHPQLEFDGSVAQLDVPASGKVTEPGPLVKMNATPATVGLPPDLDQHGAEIRRGVTSVGAPTGDATGGGAGAGRPPLDGVTVVELGTFYAGPFGSTILADLGARVIKIEPPAGDFARYYDDSVGDVSAYFAWCNRGKESVVLDLKEAADRDVAEQIIARADVLVQNLAPGAAERLGLDAVAAVARHPRLVGVDISGYGTGGSRDGSRAYDLLVQSEAGSCAVTGTADAPAKPGIPMADVGTGM